MSAYILLALFSLLLFFVLPSYKATGWLTLLSLVWAVVFAFAWDEQYFGNVGLPFAMTQPMMLVFTMFMLVTVMLDTMRKTIQQEVRLAEKVKTQETELMEARIDVMLSQIQPHFLYNSLTAIAKLCDIDSKKAKVAVTNFADYLRGNLDSIGERKLIYIVG